MASKHNQGGAEMRLIKIIVALILLASVAYAEEKFTISGEVSFQKDGDIYICLFTKDEFLDYPKHKLTRPQCQRVSMNSDVKKEGKVSFKFDSVTKGTYCIVTFQDVNMNQKIDIVGFTTTEPRSSYKEQITPMECLIWDEIKFDLTKDLKDIKIQM
jgi:uncharacterized protein (DUF2141 family)